MKDRWKQWRGRRARRREVARELTALRDRVEEFKKAWESKPPEPLPEKFERIRTEWRATNERIERLQQDLDYIDSRPVARAAVRFGVIESRRAETPFDEEARAHFQRLVTEARFTYWKRWTEIVVPILSLIVAILALLPAACGR